MDKGLSRLDCFLSAEKCVISSNIAGSLFHRTYMNAPIDFFESRKGKKLELQNSELFLERYVTIKRCI